MGKTSLSLGLVSALKGRGVNVGFMKPVGQQHVSVQGVDKQTGQPVKLQVDKDCRLFNEFFSLGANYSHMSPVVMRAGQTKRILDGGKESMAGKLLKDIQGAYQCLLGDHDFIVCEGTGHVGVGAIGGVSNATVAARLGSDVVLVSEGGLGSAFDEIYLNRQACTMAGANVVGVVLNKVIPEKRDMIEQYFKLALRDWGIPLLGCIPFDNELERKANFDVEKLFRTEMHPTHRKTHLFDHPVGITIASGTLREFETALENNVLHKQAIVVNESRTDIIDCLCRGHHPGNLVIVLGAHNRKSMGPLELLFSKCPSLYLPESGEHAAAAVVSSFQRHVAKFNEFDVARTKRATEVIARNIHLDEIMRACHP